MAVCRCVYCVVEGGEKREENTTKQMEHAANVQKKNVEGEKRKKREKVDLHEVVGTVDIS